MGFSPNTFFIKSKQEGIFMILKSADPKNTEELERLLAIAPSSVKPKIEQEIWAMRSGIKGENESAYILDFDTKDSKNRAVIHDLRLEINGRVAQIDHLMINRLLHVFVFESKNFNSGFKITEEGEFLRWNNYKKAFEGMPSPLAQNDRHITVLKDAFAQIEMPTRMGLRLAPTFHSYILVASSARIDRPRKFDTSKIVKADDWPKTFEKHIDNEGVLSTFASAAKVVASDTLVDICNKLIALHKPITINYAAKFGIAETMPAAEPATQVASPSLEYSSSPKCRSCGSDKIGIQYGKYGYYFKCGACDGNTPIKIGCGQTGHKEKLRKEGLQFLRECADCKTSSLFFTNPG
jgi:hypothetical protein